jgi:Transposase IS200 like.
MARPLRIDLAGALYHLTSRDNERRNIFRSDRDRRAFLGFLGMGAKRFGWSVTAWVLMSSHFHLVIQTLEPNLSRGMDRWRGKAAEVTAAAIRAHTRRDVATIGRMDRLA